MFRFTSILAASAAAVIAAATPAFAADSLALGPTLVADIGRDAIALGAHAHADAAIVKAVPIDVPVLEQLQNVGGRAQIAIALDANGKLTGATVLKSSGRERLDLSALDAVRASTYRAERIDGQPVSGRYVVDVEFNPAN